MPLFRVPESVLWSGTNLLSHLILDVCPFCGTTKHNITMGMSSRMWYHGQTTWRYLKPPKFEHIFVAVITFFPFFCANTFDTSLLLIVCAIRWYVKSLYRNLFLVDISKHARVTHFLICGSHNSKAPWATPPQIGLWVAKARSCDTDELKKLTWTPPWVMVLRKGGITERPHNFCVLNTITQGGVHVNFFITCPYHRGISC